MRKRSTARATAAVTTTNREALDASIELRDALERAFDGAMTIEHMRLIARASGAVVNEILRLNALELAKLGEAYQVKQEALALAIEDLKTIRRDIAKISANLKTIAEVSGAIGRVARFLPL